MSSFTPGHAQPVPDAPRRYVYVVGGAVWSDEGEPADPAWPAHFVGMHGEHAVWAVDVPAGEDPADGAALDLYSLYARRGEVEGNIAGRAAQLVEWARTHRFCGRCGTPTRPHDSERSMRCPACGLAAFPRLAPAMIVLVTHGEGEDEACLLAHGAQFRAPFYSCLAGFVEPGESLEESVGREVAEEVGITVADVRYVTSQPWPFPHSLMLGFRATAESRALDLDPTEIVDARWCTRAELRSAEAPMLPPPISIARKLIDAWLSGHEGPRAAR